MTDLTNRRPLKSRDAAWAKGLARDLAKGGFSPDMVSFFSMVFAVMGAVGFAASAWTFGTTRILAFVLAALGIQLRLLCNLLDGMVAVEHGKAGPYGPIWNELPDRFSDVALMLGAGFAASPIDPELGPALGVVCALLAVLTAYVRELGRGLGQPADFCGPMAKPQRMAALTVAAAGAATEDLWDGRGQTLFWALIVIAVLTAVTLARRVGRLGKRLKQSPSRSA